MEDTNRINKALSIYDVSGRQIECIKSGEISSGKYTYSLSSKYSKGIYFARMKLDNETYTTKVLKIK